MICFPKVSKVTKCKWLGPYKTEGINLENRTCQLRGWDGKILERETNLKDVKIYKAQYVSSGDDRDQDGLSPAQNEEVKTPLSAAVPTATPQQGDVTRHPPNRTHKQARDCVPSPSSTSVYTRISNQVFSDWLAPQKGDATRVSVCSGRKKREATRPQPSCMPEKVEATRPSVSAGLKQKEAARRQPSRMPEQTINVVFTKSSTAVQEDAAQPPPIFSLHQKEAPSLLPNSTPQQRRKDQSKRPACAISRTAIRR